MTTLAKRQQAQETREYRAKSVGWAASRCPDWCDRRHLTDAIWFARNDFHMSARVAVHLPAVPDTDTTTLLYEDDIEVYIESSGPAMKEKWGPSIYVNHPGNVEWEDTTILDADQAEELALALLGMVRLLRDTTGGC